MHGLVNDGIAPVDRFGLVAYPTYSPTGDRVVASRQRSPESVVFNPGVAWESQTPQRLELTLPGGSWLVPTSWSPDGRRMVGGILNTSGSPIGIGVYDIAAKQVKKVFDGLAPYWGYQWLRDNRRVLYIIDDALWMIDVDSGKRQELVSGIRFGLGLLLSPDNKTIYASLSRQQADLWMLRVQ